MYITGGNYDHHDKPSRRALRLDIRNNEQQRLPSLIEARYGHASMILSGQLFVFGGDFGINKFLSSIECYDTKKKTGWHTLLQGNVLVARSRAGIAAIDATQIIVYGGNSMRGWQKNGYKFDVTSHSVKKMFDRYLDGIATSEG